MNTDGIVAPGLHDKLRGVCNDCRGNLACGLVQDKILHIERSVSIETFQHDTALLTKWSLLRKECVGSDYDALRQNVFSLSK